MTEEKTVADNADETPKPSQKRKLVNDGKPEIWVFVSGVLAVATIVCWAVVFAKIGRASIVAHAMVAPTLGALTVPIMVWGLAATLFRPPALQKYRIIGFFTLLGVGYLNNVPLFAPPLSTDDWKGPVAQLPLKRAYVSAGGEGASTNYHVTTAAYRWGTDFTVAEEGKKFRLDGKKNTDFFCFGTPVTAPVSGRVVDVKNDIADNTPGEVRPEFDQVFGNHVVIEFAPNAYAFVAQLQFQSVPVNIGDQVTTDTVVGKCGNSGRSVEPHVHVHAQNTRSFPYSEGLPLKYNFSRNGKQVEAQFPIGESKWNAGDGWVIER